MMDIAYVEVSSLLHQVMQSLVEGVAITDKRGRLVFANQALERLLGYEPGELTGRPWTLLIADRSGRRMKSRTSNVGDVMVGRYEARLRCKDGTLIPVLASSWPLPDGNGDQATLSTFADPRESQHVAAQLMQPARQVWMGQNIASIIHELSNSLTIVSLQTQLLSKKGPLTPSVQDSLSVIREQARRMMQMVDNLRATGDPYQVELQMTDVNALIGQTLELQGNTLQMEKIQVVTKLDADPPYAGADPYKLQQVFVNLINNAREAMAATPRARRLTITTQTLAGTDSPNSQIQVRFADNGPGISEEVMPHIFEPFFTTKPGKGMGLGLSICRQIVQKHGGRIWAERGAVGGATLIVELPIVRPTAQEAVPGYLQDCDRAPFEMPIQAAELWRRAREALPEERATSSEPA